MMESLLAAQTIHEKRYNCIVCMEAKLDMVYGSCQHRLCSSCLYDERGILRSDMQRCPICAKHLAFPQIRPDIPEDNIAVQKYLGVRECPHKDQGCRSQFWDWEMEDHLCICLFEKPHKSCHPHKLVVSERNVQSKVQHTKKRPGFCTRSKKYFFGREQFYRRSSRISERVVHAEH
uniref:RING-type domain-containing protein n=1 Tax=Arion vulgaris TaxID=1028688 RepID=A0A0B6YQ46_9EUPU